MTRTFEVFKHPTDSQAVKRGFSWPGFFFTCIWALVKRLWLVGGVVLVISLVVSLVSSQTFRSSPLLVVCASLVVRLVVGRSSDLWRSDALQADGYAYIGAIEARDAAAALARVAQLGGVIPTELKVHATGTRLLSLPPALQGLFAIAGLTWKAALRFRLFLVLAVLLLAAVVGLPLLLKDDGTARGFTQILITYTLSAVTALLGLSTLWLACGTLARDIEECQIQVVAVKPIARWQIWLGKWLGLMSLNAALLAVSGASVYALLQWRATRLPTAEQTVLRNEVLVARGSAKERSFEDEIRAATEQRFQERMQKNPVSSKADVEEVRKQIREQVKAEYQVIQPGYVRPWEIDLGRARYSLKDRPLQVRFKFNTADLSPSGAFGGVWGIGVPRKTALQEVRLSSLAPDTFHEFEIQPNLFDENGLLTITFFNPNNTALLFPLEEGLEVLYREGGFGLNFARGLGVIFCWMALLATLGLAAASFLSFPVAAFCSLGVLAVAFSTGTLASALEQGTLGGFDSEKGKSGHLFFDKPALWVFAQVLRVVRLAKDFSPIDSLSTGRSVTWGQLGLAVGQVVFLLGGVIALGGIALFTRRELATAQGTQ